MIKIKPAGKNELTNSLPAFTLWSGGLAPPKMEGKPPLLSDFPYFSLYHTRLCQATNFYMIFLLPLAYLKTIFTSYSILFFRKHLFHPTLTPIYTSTQTTLH